MLVVAECVARAALSGRSPAAATPATTSRDGPAVAQGEPGLLRRRTAASTLRQQPLPAMRADLLGAVRARRADEVPDRRRAGRARRRRHGQRTADRRRSEHELPRELPGLARRRRAAATSTTTRSRSTRARSSSTSSTGCRPPRPPTSRCGGTARPASAARAAPRSTARPRLHVHDPDVAPSPRTRPSRSRRCAPSRSSGTSSPTCRSTTRRRAQIPAFAPPADLAPGEYRMQQVDVERSQEFRKCIECFLCQNTCHVIRDHEENKAAFAGPRFLIRAAELDMHPLDARTTARTSRRTSRASGCATSPSAAPRSAPSTSRSPTTRSSRMKERVVDRKYDPLVWLGSKIRRRT